MLPFTAVSVFTQLIFYTNVRGVFKHIICVRRMDGGMWAVVELRGVRSRAVAFETPSMLGMARNRFFSN